MWFWTCIVAFLIGLNVTHAFAITGYVIESTNANVSVGAEVADGTGIAVSDGGHVVILTLDGQMLRRNGAFEGTAADAFAIPVHAKANIEAGVLAALIDIARDDGTAQNKVFGTRAMSGDAVNALPFAITVETTVYCLRRGVAPVFLLANPSPADTLITLDRYDAPAASVNARWPANQALFPWPDDWPSPRVGNYEWMAGKVLGKFEVRRLPSGAKLGTPLETAVTLKDHGCTAQAHAALALAIDDARLMQ